jgi:acetyl esterase/lipase
MFIVLVILLSVFFGRFIVTNLNIIHSGDAIHPNWTNVSYANESSAEKMDIYLPNTTGPYPVVIWIHGGRYLVGDKSSIDHNFIEEALKRGYAVVSINYRLAEEAKYPAQIYDVKAAIRFLRANSETYNLNPDKFAISGSSAGGGLAALAGTSADVQELQNDSLGYGNVSNRVQAVVDLKGPINFGTFMSQLQQINKTQRYWSKLLMNP